MEHEPKDSNSDFLSSLKQYPQIAETKVLSSNQQTCPCIFFFIYLNFFFNNNNNDIKLNIDLVYKYFLLIVKTPNYLLNFLINNIKKIFLYLIHFKYKRFY